MRPVMLTTLLTLSGLTLGSPLVHLNFESVPAGSANITLETGGPCWTYGVFGPGSQVELGASLFAELQESTVAMWFRIDQHLEGGYGHCLFYAGGWPADWQGNRLLLECGHPDRPDAGYAHEGLFWTVHAAGSTPTQCCSTVDNISIGDWHHVAVTVRDADTHFYLDGAELLPGASLEWNFGSAAVAQTFADVAPIDTALLGCGQMWGEEIGLTGAIDEFRIYDHALATPEIQALATVPEPAAMATWLFILALLPRWSRAGLDRPSKLSR